MLPNNQRIGVAVIHGDAVVGLGPFNDFADLPVTVAAEIHDEVTVVGERMRVSIQCRPHFDVRNVVDGFLEEDHVMALRRHT